MSVARVCHEARRQCNDAIPFSFAGQRTVRLNILSRVCVVAVPIDVLADVPDPASKVPIEVEEGYVEALRQKSTDRALAGSAGTNQPNHRIEKNSYPSTLDQVHACQMMAEVHAVS